MSFEHLKVWPGIVSPVSPVFFSIDLEKGTKFY